VKLFSVQKPQTRQKKSKVPKYLQQRIGEANGLYSFGRFDEAIQLFESVLKEMPDLADVTYIMSLIYSEKKDYEKAFMYAWMSAIETRTDSSKWQNCARIATLMGRYSHAIYLLNRAVKALDSKTQYREIVRLKM
jgi:tetratricopeptide (TPR) repeat protein